MDRRRCTDDDACVVRIKHVEAQAEELLRAGFLKWTTFTWIIGACCAVGLMLMGMGYNNMVVTVDRIEKGLQEKIKHNEEDLHELHKTFSAVDEKLDRNFMFMQQISGIKYKEKSAK